MIMARAVLHLEKGVSLEAIGRPGEVLNEARQVLATAQLCVERVLIQDGDDGSLRQVMETLHQWEKAASKL